MPDMENREETTPWMWSKIIWKGIPPNAAAQDPKERVQLNSIHTQYKPVDHYKNY